LRKEITMKIKIDPSKKLTLYSQEFDEMRNNLDLTLQTTLKAMIAKNMDAAAIGLKINVELIKVDLADDNAPTGTRPAMKPEISARIVAAMQQRVDKKCNVIGRASKKEILIDDDGNMCLVSEEEASGQLSMFNTYMASGSRGFFVLADAHICPKFPQEDLYNIFGRFRDRICHGLTW